MKLHSLYTPDIQAECLAFAEAAKPTDNNRERWLRKSARSIVAFLNEIEPLPGSEKWVRLSHYQTLSFYALNVEGLQRQSPQVIVNFRARICEIRYLLPHEHRPWVWAQPDILLDISEAARLVLDGFTRCESRPEFLLT